MNTALQLMGINIRVSLYYILNEIGIFWLKTTIRTEHLVSRLQWNETEIDTYFLGVWIAGETMPYALRL